MLNHNYFMDKKTGELVTYTQAKKTFYSIKRTAFESIFDNYTETDIKSKEKVTKPDFTTVLKV